LPFKFRMVSKFCGHCKVKLVLNSSRDIERKKFCSRSCRAKAYITPEITKLAQSMANTKEANAKKSHHGENHPMWKKDRSQVKRPRNQAEFAWWRKSVFERDHYTCTQCGEIGGNLTAHHKAPVVRFPIYKFELWNGITLCHSCHTDVHKAANELFQTGGFCNKLKENPIAVSL
jgi:5-methylcytosine-specific restriction endonuclease McrA